MAVNVSGTVFGTVTFVPIWCEYDYVVVFFDPLLEIVLFHLLCPVSCCIRQNSTISPRNLSADSSLPPGNSTTSGRAKPSLKPELNPFCVRVLAFDVKCLVPLVILLANSKTSASGVDFGYVDLKCLTVNFFPCTQSYMWYARIVVSNAWRDEELLAKKSSYCGMTSSRSSRQAS